jgi:hypothetical protein
MRDSSYAVATSSDSERPVVAEAAANAVLNCCGTGQAAAVAIRAGARLEVVACELSSRVDCAVTARSARARTVARTLRNESTPRLAGSSLRRSARLRERAKARSISAKLSTGATIYPRPSHPNGGWTRPARQM